MPKLLSMVRDIKKELQRQQPATGLERYTRIMSNMRVAGAPRAISAAKHVVIYEAMEADESIPEGLRQKAAEAKQGCMATAAYEELGDLDPEYVAAELTQFRKAVCG